MRGRKPKLEVVEPISAPSNPCPKAPSWLSAHAKAVWRKTAPDLHRRHLLSEDVAATLEHYCHQVGLVRECEEILQREGQVLEGKAHPAGRIQAGAIKEARLLAAELALTPHRKAASMPTDEGDQDDGWSDLLA
ncbi:phage terminase small subunit P27 family [Fodinicurvata fenggangensis]|uniref:phage terminase small subunit P27 family n=1 Tax=Fodinicurvata fenggangensis TaxID=1121830 RepID=UPI00047D4D22|nr:phage terminase small subunit P27 family [Fodinicurvata fenggangensis]